MTTIRKPNSTSNSTAVRKTPRKAPTKVAVKKVSTVKPAIKKPVRSAKTTLIAKKAPAPAPVVKPVTTQTVAAPKLLKEKKVKLVRDSFTIPKPEYLVLDALKARALVLGHAVKKSELLRAGVKALASMTDVQLISTLKSVPTLKSGRPGK